MSHTREPREKKEKLREIRPAADTNWHQSSVAPYSIDTRGKYLLLNQPSHFLTLKFFFQLLEALKTISNLKYWKFPTSMASPIKVPSENDVIPLAEETLDFDNDNLRGEQNRYYFFLEGHISVILDYLKTVD